METLAAAALDAEPEPEPEHAPNEENENIQKGGDQPNVVGNKRHRRTKVEKAKYDCDVASSKLEKFKAQYASHVEEGRLPSDPRLKTLQSKITETSSELERLSKIFKELEAAETANEAAQEGGG